MMYKLQINGIIQEVTQEEFDHWLKTGEEPKREPPKESCTCCHGAECPTHDKIPFVFVDGWEPDPEMRCKCKPEDHQGVYGGVVMREGIPFCLFCNRFK